MLEITTFFSAAFAFQTASLQAQLIEVMHERSECVCENSYRVWSVEGSTEGTSQGAEPRGRSPRLIPTHDTRGGIEHTLEHMSECIINTTQT